MSQILESAYQVQVTLNDTSSFVRVFYEKMRQVFDLPECCAVRPLLILVCHEFFLQLMSVVSFRNFPKVDSDWKKNVAKDMISQLHERKSELSFRISGNRRYTFIHHMVCFDRLARAMCMQIKDRLRQSHERFEEALEALRNHHNGRLQRTEQLRRKVKKQFSPRVARLTLESFSFKDYLLFGKRPLRGERFLFQLNLFAFVLSEM